MSNLDLDLRKVRSILSVPAHDERKTLGARSRGADLIMWDLEASVPGREKSSALARVSDALAIHGDAVRIDNLRRGIDRLRERGLVFVVPHVETFSDIAFLEGEKVVALVESPAGILGMGKLIDDATRYTLPLLGLAFGRWDFEATVGFPCSLLLGAARAQVALHAHVAGIACWDAPAPRQESVIEAQVSRSFGFTGKGCVHPSQIADVHKAWEIPAGWNPLPYAAHQEPLTV